MKKKLLVLLALGLVYVTTYAQENKLRFGLTVFPTLNVIKPDVDAIEKTKNGLGFSYGLLTDFTFRSNYSFSTGLLISQFNGTISYPDRAFPDENDRSNNFPATTEAKLKLQYIEIPLTLKLRTNEIGYITYYGQFGLGLGINIKATQDLEIKYNSQTLTVDDQEINDDIKLFRSALVVGGGIEYNLSGNTAIQVGITFNNGFTNILNGKVAATDGNGDVQVDSNNEIVRSDKDRSATNNYFALNLGIFF